MSQEIIEKIKQRIEGYQADQKWEEIGKILKLAMELLKFPGLPMCKARRF